MAKPDSTGSWLFSSMSNTAKRTALLLGLTTLVIAVVLAGVMCSVGTAPSPVDKTPVVTSVSASGQGDQSNSEASATDGTEQIEDDSVPLAAGAKRRTSPTFVLAIGSFAAVVLFFVVRIRRVNASITDMSHRKR